MPDLPSPRYIAVKAVAWFAMGLIALGPVSFLILHDAGGEVWALTALVGMAVAAIQYRRWWPELRHDKKAIWCIGVLSVHLAIVFLNYFLVDASDFAISRAKRQLLFLGVPFGFLLLWWLRPRLQAVLTLIALNATAFGLYALWFSRSHAGRVDGVTHAVHFGNVSLLLAFASLALIPVTRHYGWRILAVSGLVLGVGASVLSGARGGWIAAPVLIVITLMTIFRVFRPGRYMLTGLIGVIVLALAGLWHTDIVQTRITDAQEDFAQLSNNHWSTSIGFRILMWEQAWLEIREAPIQGTGFSGYRERVLQAVESGELPEGMIRFSTEPHSEYLYQWATRGAVGLLFFILCLAGGGWYFFRLLWRGGRSQAVVAHVGLSVIGMAAVGGLTITIVDQREVIRFLGWILTLILYCLWVCETHDRPGED